jgi:hypothetical protein
MVGAAWHPAQQIFGADDGQQIGLCRPVDGCGDHQPAGAYRRRAGLDEGVDVGDMLDDLEGRDDVEGLAGHREFLGRRRPIVDVEAAARRMCPGDLDILLGRIDGDDGSVEAPERLRNDAGTAADIEEA